MKKIKTMKCSAAMKEAELVFEKFVSLNDFNSASTRTEFDKKRGEKVGKKDENKNNILDKFRTSLKRYKAVKSNEPDKENNDHKLRTHAKVKQNDKDARDFKRKTSSKTSKVLAQERNEEKVSPGRKSPPTFWLISPPPPVPSPRFLDSLGSNFMGMAFDGELGIQLVEEEDDSDDIDGESDHFEDVSDLEKQRRAEEVSKMIDKIVEREFGYKTENTMSKSTSSASISSLSQHLTSDLSYKFFKTEVDSFIRSHHNDKLLSQIGLLFSIARSAIKKVGSNSSEAKEVSRNAMKFFKDAYVPLVSEAGGLESLLQPETEIEDV